jgi:hypothetical protein
MREDPVDEMRGDVGHAAAAAGAANPPTLAEERDNLALAAGVAVNAQKSSRQIPAIQERPQFALDEPGRRSLTLPLPCQESLELCSHNAIVGILLRITRAVFGSEESFIRG